METALVVSIGICFLILNNAHTHNFMRYGFQLKISSAPQVYDSCSIFIDKYKFISSENESVEIETAVEKDDIIRLVDIRSGWGNGAHPTTKLCLDFICSTVIPGDTFLDYGTGSGILSIFAAKLGAKKCLAVDVDDESLRAAAQNALLNGVDDKIEVVHTKTIYLGDNSFSQSDVTVANILPGALNRLAGTIWLMTKPGGVICLSGMRPAELPAIRQLYLRYVEESTESTMNTSHELYGLDRHFQIPHQRYGLSILVS